MKPLGRRGVETSFHWIFVVIAGGLILFLFAILIRNGLSIHQEGVTAKSIADLNTIFSTLRSVDDLDEMTGSTSDIEFTCDILDESPAQDAAQVSINSLLKMDDLARSIKDTPVFSFRKLSGEHIIYKTHTFRDPYVVDTAIYLTTDSTKYVFVGSQTLFEKFKEFFPRHATIERVDAVKDIRRSGFDSIVIIGVNRGVIVSESFVEACDEARNQVCPSDPLPDDILKSASVSYRDILLSPYQFEGSTNVTYYGVKRQRFGLKTIYEITETDTVAADSKEELLGAILSNDAAFYLCNKYKLQIRRYAAGSILSVRSSLLSNQAAAGACRPLYAALSAGGGVNELFVDPTNRNKEDMRAANTVLGQKSCPRLY